jgi:hypothetical protein
MTHEDFYLSDANHAGPPSIKYNCFAHAYGVKECFLSDVGMDQLISAGDLLKVDTVENANLAVHYKGLLFGAVHANKITAGTITPTINCSESSTLANLTQTKPLSIWRYEGKIGMGCIHKLSLSDLEGMYGPFAKTVYYKKP